MRIPNCIRVKDWSKVTFSMSFISEGQQEKALLSVGSHGIRSCIRITRPNRRGVGYVHEVVLYVHKDVSTVCGGEVGGGRWRPVEALKWSARPGSPGTGPGGEDKETTVDIGDG